MTRQSSALALRTGRACAGRVLRFLRVSFLVVSIGLLSACGDDNAALCDIDSDATNQPFSGGQSVVVAGVVSAITEAATGEARGVFFQSESSDRGLLAIGNLPEDVEPGRRISVRGQINADGDVDIEAVAACGKGQPIVPIVTSAADAFDHHPGALVALDGDLRIVDVSRLHQDGSIIVAVGDQPMKSTEVYRPGPQAERLAQSNRQRMITLDDVVVDGVVDSLVYWPQDLSLKTIPRVGDQISGVVGVADAGSWPRLRLVEPVVVESRRAQQRFSAPQGNLTLASFNVQNYFNGDGLGGGFPTERGASSADELARQKAKIAATIIGLGRPDIVALNELENDGYGPQSAIASLVDTINQAVRAPSELYAFVEPPVQPLGEGPISVGLIYRIDKVEPVGAPRTLPDGAFSALHRVPLRQVFRRISGTDLLDVTVVHLKSKGCRDATDANRAAGDGQGCYNAARTAAAEQLAGWLEDSENAVVIGDFNAYSQEDPVETLRQAGFVSLVDTAAARAYSYIYQGEAGSLDHAMATSNLAGKKRDAKIWQINAGFSAWLDWRIDGKTPALAQSLYRATATRTSDHNPLVIGLDLK